MKALKEAIVSHLHSYAFSSVNVWLAKALPLDITSIKTRFDRGEGGYCFEHNKLFFHQLQSQGYDVRLILARVLLNQNIDVPKTHRFSLVTIDNRDYLVDVGFGAYTPPEPIIIDGSYTMSCNGYTYAIKQIDTYHKALVIQKGEEDFILYSFNEKAIYSEADCDMAHYYSHTSSDANFVNNLVLAKYIDGKIHSLYNREYKILDSHMIKTVKTQSELTEILCNIFGQTLGNNDISRIYLKLRAPL